MSKEYLEALKIGIPKLKEFFKKNAHKMSFNDNLGFDLTFAYLDKELQRLEAIENAKPSKALDGLEYICEILKEKRIIDIKWVFKNEYNTIKQALLKAQEKDKVIEIIKKKCLYNDNLNYVAVCINYDMYKEKMSEKHDTKVIKTNWDDKVLLDCLKLLTKEEFELLKRYIDGSKS